MQKKLTAGEYEILQGMQEHFETARVGYVRGFTSDQQKQLRGVHNAHFDTFVGTNPTLCGECVVTMLRDLLPLFDSYTPAEAEAEQPKKDQKKSKK